VPSHKAPLKRMRQDKRKRARNRSAKSALKKAAKGIRQAPNAAEAGKLMPAAASLIDRAAKKHVIHWRTAARMKSRLAKRANAPAS